MGPTGQILGRGGEARPSADTASDLFPLPSELSGQTKFGSSKLTIRMMAPASPSQPDGRTMLTLRLSSVAVSAVIQAR